MKQRQWRFGQWMLVVALALGGVAIPAASASEVDVLLSKLVEKGILTASEAQEVRNEVNPELTKQEDRLTKLEKDVADKSVVHVGKGSLKVGGLFQGWALYDAHDKDRIRIRRTEVKLAGDILGDDRFKYTVMFDPAQVQEDNTRRAVLQDAYFTFDHLPFLANHKIDLGQMKPPVTEEGFRSSSKLDFAERSIIGRTFGDQRDIGAMLTGDWPLVTYQLGLFNGNGLNKADNNDQKDLAGRLVVRPLKALSTLVGAPDLGQLELGVNGYHRPAHGIAQKKKRLGYEARYEYQNLSLKGEYMLGQGTASANATTENSTPAKGWYVQGGYTLAPWVPELQAIARFEGWDPNTRTSLDGERDLTIGFNYFFDKYNAKWQLNWVHQAKQNGKVDNQVIFASQVAF